MSRRNGRYLAALGGLIGALLLADIASAQTITQPEQPNNEQKGAYNPASERYAGVTLACQPSGTGDAYTCHREKPSEPLTASAHIHRWLFRAVRDPIAVLTLLLFVIGGWQLHVARGTARRQLRAYVFADTVTLTEGRDLTPLPFDAGVLRGAIVIKNTGQTPALEVSHWSFMGILRRSEFDALRPLNRMPPFAGTRSVFSIPASGQIYKRLIFRALTDAEISEIQTGVSLIVVYGRIEYKDAHGRRHHTNYRLFGGGNYPLVMTDIYNFAEEGNDAD